MFTKLLILLSFLSVSVLASSIELDYETKEIIRLKRVAHGDYVESLNSRVQTSSMYVRLKHQKNRQETHFVHIEKEDRLKDFKTIRVSRKKNVKASVKKSVNKRLRRQVRHLLANLSSSSRMNKIRVKVKSLKINCNKRNKNLTVCYVNAQVSGKLNSKKLGSISLLKKYLNDLKKEMKEYHSVTYDIEGYLDFLSKSEDLVSRILTKTSSSKKITKLVKIKQFLINERIDSYEYTAIRSKSVVRFVNKVLRLIKTT